MEPRSQLVPWGAHEVHVAEWGERGRETVVMWHGLARQCRDFDACARALARDYRVLCPDTIGRGLSSWAADPRREYCFASYARLALALLDAFHVDRVRWVGTSMGGTLGVVLAAGQLRDRVTHLILNDIAPERPEAALGRVLRLGDPPSFATVTELQAYFRHVYEPFGPLSDEEWRSLAEHSLRRRDDGRLTVHYDPRLTEQLVEYPNDYRRWREYDAVRAPTLLLRGERSDMVSAAWATEMARRGPRCRVETIAGCGHAPYLNTAAQIGVVMAFLAA